MLALCINNYELISKQMDEIQIKFRKKLMQKLVETYYLARVGGFHMQGIIRALWQQQTQARRRLCWTQQKLVGFS